MDDSPLRHFPKRLRQIWHDLRELQTGAKGAIKHGDERISPMARRFRGWFRRLARWVEHTLTRTRITGLENIPKERPLIFAANHASTYDAVLFMAHLPEDTELVGPGDFRLLFPANILVPLAGIVLIKRSTLDRESLRLMGSALEAGMNLALFPEGGTWEKRLDDVKQGVAYLSHLHNAPIVPISFGGTYHVWARIVRLQRPHITIHIGKPLPPVHIEDRKQRAETLQRTSLELMQAIYAHLPPADQHRYDIAARQQFHALLTAVPGGRPAGVSQGEQIDFVVLAELVSKPNLISPLWRNARLPLTPLLKHSTFYAAADFVVTAERLQSAFEGDFKGYLNYRLGDVKAATALQELAALRRIALAAHQQRQRLRFTPIVELADVPLPPNT
jgi:1-acyl-sn-glycerol-3-phosphate acyltransferase